MPASNLYMSWKDITCVQGATTVNLDESTELELDPSETLLAWRANGRRFAKLHALSESDRRLTISGGDVNKHLLVLSSGVWVITAKLWDVTNGAGQGCITLTANGCSVQRRPVRGQSQRFAMGSLTFVCASPTDVDPWAFAVAP